LKKEAKYLSAFLKHFESFIKVSHTLKVELQNKIEVHHFKKGEIILSADQVCNKSYFIHNGMFRLYHLKDGREVSEYFCAENEWVNSPRSFYQQTPDIYYIDAVEDTICFSLSVKNLVYLFDHFPEMERYSRLSMGHIVGHLMEKVASMKFSSAKEKYDHFISVYKDTHYRIPLGMIATYLGITQETLSRIRLLP
jgi:CRP-like cAMP-binding protein